MANETPLRLRKRAYALVIAVAAALGGLLFGYDTSVISGAILFVRQQFHLTPVQTEMAVSIVLAGAALGAGSAGSFGDRYGRRPVLIVNALFFGLFAVLTGMANGLGTFLVARFMIGMAVGVASMLTPLYIAELAPPKVRGALVTLNQLAIVTGIVVAYYVDYLFANSANWRIMFISAVVPSVVLLVALIFLPESPRWLVIRQREDEAFRILDRVESTEDARRHLKELQDITETDRLRFRDLFGGRFKRPLMIGVGLAVFQQITGINAILYYTPTILQMAGFKSASSAILATVLVGGVNFVVTVVALLLLDHVGRRPLLLFGIAGMILTLTCLGYLFGAEHVSRAAILTDVLAYLACFAIGLGPVFWLLISEIYPTTIRGQAMSVASVTIWLSDLLVSMTFLSLMDAAGAKYSSWIYAAACVAAFIFSFRLIPETKGRTLEEIEASWAGKSVPIAR
ncbi:MAG TPA: sugar porter family MFS transporter [Terriglobia bacterium]|jgi:sugar porter (SP) family MFS transporter|nr:sugar porter family MFS transporter [Terriglobia bacterium]